MTVAKRKVSLWGFLALAFTDKTRTDAFVIPAQLKPFCSPRSDRTNLSATAQQYRHGLAILRMPHTSVDRIANEAILETALRRATKLSVVLRSSNDQHSLAALRRYAGEVYSTLWDCVNDADVADVVVYPQNLPNAAPEQWIHHREDLDMVCSHDSICGWFSESASGRGTQFWSNRGQGGLNEHVEALNLDRQGRGLGLVDALHVEPWPLGASLQFQQDNHVVFLDDPALMDHTTVAANGDSQEGDDLFLGGARIDSQSLYNSVCVGGTFDGMHYGHCKLLTLAVSSVLPQTGTLLVGVTVDEMLQHKALANLIPPLEERINGVRQFLDRLAPGMKNRVKVVPITDAYGPPGSLPGEFDALVLSHETLENGHLLNQHRIHNLGLKPLELLCTRRTEAYGMSSTALRKRKAMKQTKSMK